MKKEYLYGSIALLCLIMFCMNNHIRNQKKLLTIAEKNDYIYFKGAGQYSHTLIQKDQIISIQAAKNRNLTQLNLKNGGNEPIFVRDYVNAILKKIDIDYVDIELTNFERETIKRLESERKSLQKLRDDNDRKLFSSFDDDNKRLYADSELKIIDIDTKLKILDTDIELLKKIENITKEIEDIKGQINNKL